MSEPCYNERKTRWTNVRCEENKNALRDASIRTLPHASQSCGPTFIASCSAQATPRALFRLYALPISQASSQLDLCRATERFATMSRLEWTDILISEVKNRSILWDTTHKNYHNRHAVDEEWATVGKLGEVSGTDAKLKWKSLRDSFRRELKKMPRCGKNKEKSWRSKWAYFNSMLFLKDVMQSREPHGSIVKKTDDSLDYTEENDASDLIGDRTIESDADNEANESQTKREEEFIQDTELTNVCTIRHAHLPLETSFAFTTPPFCKRSRKESDSSKSSRTSSKRKKRVEKSDVFGTRLADAENKKMDVYQDNNNDDDDNDDLNFFKSLLPYIRQLPTLKKLRIRAQYQTILINAIQELEYKKTAAIGEYSSTTASSVIPEPSSSPSTFSNYQQERAFQSTPDPLLQPSFLNCQTLCKSEY